MSTLIAGNDNGYEFNIVAFVGPPTDSKDRRCVQLNTAGGFVVVSWREFERVAQEALTKGWRLD